MVTQIFGLKPIIIYGAILICYQGVYVNAVWAGSSLGFETAGGVRCFCSRSGDERLQGLSQADSVVLKALISRCGRYLD